MSSVRRFVTCLLHTERNRPHMAKGFEQLLPSLLLALCLSLIAPGLPYGPTPASAATSNISPVLLSQMAADPLKPLAIIVEMDHATPPFAPSASVQLAQQAVTLLATSGGRPIGALPLIDSAAGWANAAVIKTLSGLPGVAYIHADATVRPRPAPRGPAWPPGKVASLYPQEVNADRVWSLPGGQGSGVSVAI